MSTETTTKRKKWKDMTFDEKVVFSQNKHALMSDPETRAVTNTLNAHYKDMRKRNEKIKKLHTYLLAKRGLSA